MASDTRLVAVNARERNSRSGSIGAATRRLPDAGTRPAPTTPTASGAEHLRRRPAEVVAAHDAPHDARPGRRWPAPRRPGRGARTGRGSPRGSGSRAAIVRMPTGTLNQKIQCHEMPSTTAPPMTGPIATATPAMPDQMPSATPRRPGGKACASSVSVSGVTIGAADALDGAGGDQRVGAGGERGGGRGDREEAQAEHEHAPAAEPVAERRPGQQQHRERERVARSRTTADR